MHYGTAGERVLSALLIAGGVMALAGGVLAVGGAITWVLLKIFDNGWRNWE